jgi:hypothetical protein
MSPNQRTAAIYYFITALFVLLACFDTYFALPLNVSTVKTPVCLSGIKSVIHNNLMTYKTITFTEEYHVLGCGVMWVYCKPMFRRNVSPPSSG